MEYTVFIWPLLLTSSSCAGLALYSRHYFDVPAARPFSFMMVLATLWTIIYALNISVVNLPIRVFLSLCIYVPTRLIPPVILALAVEYTGNERVITKRNSIIVFFIPILAIIASLTSPWHTLFRYGFQLETTGPVSVLQYKGGPLYLLSNIYGDILLLFSLGMLVYALRDKALHVKNTLAMILGLLIPISVDILFTLGITPIPGYNFAATSIGITGFAFLWAILRFRLFSVASIARATVVENISDILIVFDMRGHIIDFNNAAKEACGLDSRRAIGSSVNNFSREWVDFFQRYAGCDECREDLPLIIGGVSLIFDVTISPIRDSYNRVVGRLFLLHDITDRRKAELQVKQLLQEKELLLREVHHRVKNNMSVIAGILSLHAATLKGTPARNALLDARSRVQSMMVLYDRLYRASGVTDTSMRDYFSPLIDTIVGNFPNATNIEIVKRIDDFSVSARTLFPIGIITNELITNAMKHAFVRKTHGTITVSAFCEGERASVVVDDDGDGLPEGIELSTCKGFGFQLINMLVTQIGATVNMSRGDGTRFVLVFNL